MTSNLLKGIPPSVPVTLSQRINPRNDFPINTTNANNPPSFVLYLPTVVLRKKHNPAFALACHLANAHDVPLVVLVVVLDDMHLPNPLPRDNNLTTATKPIVFTARRTAFVLEALQEATQAWEAHGAGVAIRVHGPQCRTPHHLTLARQALAVVTDEPFVHPYRSFVDTLEKAVQFAKIPLYCVDGSTTVPPVHKLQRKTRDAHGRIVYQDAPGKAWQWEKKTNPNRKGQVWGTVKDGHLDAPELVQKLNPSFFLEQGPQGVYHRLYSNLPEYWKTRETSSPGKRPWTVEELKAIKDLKAWVMEWPGIDATVPPCSQTHGSYTAGMHRWNAFRANHLEHYAKLRNNITKPHAVSRMSCYFNYGVVSIFQIVADMWDSKQGKLYKGVCKFEDELIKWREIGYVHAFANPDYNLSAAVPVWATRWLDAERNSAIGNHGTKYTLEALETGNTEDAIWNAMQQYLVETGELHNNARMTWGKTLVHWFKHDNTLAELLHQMVYINDRYALDGLSPPSYAGLLWCLGWCDKPANGQGAISQKPASRYRHGPNGFIEAKQALLNGEAGLQKTLDLSQMFQTPKKRKKAYEDASSSNGSNSSQKAKSSFTATKIRGQTTLNSYFKVGS